MLTIYIDIGPSSKKLLRLYIVLTDSPENHIISPMKTRRCNTVEAKAKLNELLDDVVNGDTIIIQRRGKPVAQLTAATAVAADHKATTKSLFQRLRDFHKRVRKNHPEKSHTVDILREIREES